MVRKTKVKLDSLTSKFFIYTHCESLQFVANESLDDNTEITCAICDIPTIIRGSNGNWYHVGDPVF